MGREGVQQQQQGPHIALGAAVGIEVVDQSHHGGDSGVELHGLNVVRHLPDGLVDPGLVGGGVFDSICD